MNKVCLLGRISQNIDVRNSNGTTVARTSIAVQREFKDKSTGEYGVDFLNIVAFGKQAEFLEKYFSKGMRIGVTGHIQTGSFTDKNNNKRYTFDIVADSLEFTESKNNSSVPAPQNEPQTTPANDGFADVTDGDGFTNVADDLELPFE